MIQHEDTQTVYGRELMRTIDTAFMETPWYGPRQMARHLRRQGWCIGHRRVRRLMRRIGLSPIYQAPKTSKPHPQHRIYPYPLPSGDRAAQSGLVRRRDLHSDTVRLSLSRRNVFIKRLWRSLKYERVFLNAFETGSAARGGIGS